MSNRSYTPQWYMREVEMATAAAKRRLRPFGAMYKPTGPLPLKFIRMGELTDHAVSSPRFMGVFDPTTSGMEHALTLELIAQYKRERRERDE